MQFISPPRVVLPWNNHWLIQSTGKPEKINGGKDIISLHDLFTEVSFNIPDKQHFYREECAAAPTSAAYPCLKLLSNNIMSAKTKH